MKDQRLIRLIKVDDYSVTAKYLQIAHSITRNVSNGRIAKGDLLPSINELSYELDIARDTVERAYKYLREMGVIDSVPRKGYFIKSTNFKQNLKIFLLFNKLSEHKKIIYDSFVATLGTDAAIDFYIYNNDFSLFKKLIAEKDNDYTHYVILPHFLEGGDNAHEVINALPKEKLILLDKRMSEVTGEYGGVYENFEEDIYTALKQALKQIRKYQRLKIIFPENSYYPAEIQKGAERFCNDYGFQYQSVKNVEQEDIQKGEVYISVMEDDLVTLIERILKLKLKVGKEVGVISYNETRIKKLILDGITTVSTDFHQLGAKAAEMILSNTKEHIEIPFSITLRQSL
jgi:DNA-binding transcriptional regulator YhcF (GntR family)